MRIENFPKLKRCDHSPKRDEFIYVSSDPPYFSLDSPFKACLFPIRTYRSQWSICPLKAVADSFLLLIRVTPSTFFMGPLWDSERPAGLDFASLKQKKVRRSSIRRIERPADRLDTFAAITSHGMRRQQSLFLRPSTKTSPGTTIWDFSA